MKMGKLGDVAGITSEQLSTAVKPEAELEVIVSRDRKVFEVPLKKIKVIENSRQIYDDTKMAELMSSMRGVGLMQPIGLSKEPGKDYYRLVFGGRRYQAAQKLGWRVIDAVLAPLSDKKRKEDMMVKNIIENVQRDDVSLPEQGRGFAELLKEGLTPPQVAARIGKQPKFVRDALEAFYRIPKKYQNRITTGTRGTMKKEGEIPAATAFKVLRVARTQNLNQTQTEQLFDLAQKQDVSSDHFNIIGNLLEREHTLKDACSLAKKTRIITLQFAMDEQRIKMLEKKYEGVSVHDIAYTWLEQNKELDVHPLSKKHHSKTVVVTRKAKA